MRTTLNFEIARRPRKNGAHQIYLRVTENGIHFKQILDVYVFDTRNINAQAKNGNWINAKKHQIYLDNRQYGTTIQISSFKKKLLEYNNLITYFPIAI